MRGGGICFTPSDLLEEELFLKEKIVLDEKLL